jgi:polyphosphate kinase
LLGPSQRDFLARYFADSVEPILTPLAADAAHPFPFISNLGLNLAVLITEPGHRNPRFVRIKVPANRPRWVPLPGHAGWAPLEQISPASWLFRRRRAPHGDVTVAPYKRGVS